VDNPDVTVNVTATAHAGGRVACILVPLEFLFPCISRAAVSMVFGTGQPQIICLHSYIKAIKNVAIVLEYSGQYFSFFGIDISYISLFTYWVFKLIWETWLPYHTDGHESRRREVYAKPRTALTVVAAVIYAFPYIAANSKADSHIPTESITWEDRGWKKGMSCGCSVCSSYTKWSHYPAILMSWIQRFRVLCVTGMPFSFSVSWLFNDAVNIATI
jgi:hypothetical protein